MKDLTQWGNSCKVYNLFDVLGKKWTIFIIYAIQNWYNTFNSITRVLKMSSKVLSERLSQLENENVIKFDIDKKNWRTTYVLTQKWQSISDYVLKLSDVVYEIDEE